MSEPQLAYLCQIPTVTNMFLSNRRRHPRFPFHSYGTLWLGTNDYSGTLLDISLNGALFSLEQAPALSVGLESKLTVYYAGKTAFLTIHGRIMHVSGQLTCIEFISPGKTLQQSLQRLIDLNLGSSQLLKRELPALLR